MKKIECNTCPDRFTCIGQPETCGNNIALKNQEKEEMENKALCDECCNDDKENCPYTPLTCGINRNAELDNTVSTGFMIDMLLDNPRRKATIADKHQCSTVIINKNNTFAWEHNGVEVRFKPFHKDRRWTITEPSRELKKMTFAEAFKRYKEGKEITSIKSEITYQLFNTHCAQIQFCDDEEVDGLWTVEGIYEDD
jgi:hypothetical protein